MKEVQIKCHRCGNVVATVMVPDGNKGPSGERRYECTSCGMVTIVEFGELPPAYRDKYYLPRPWYPPWPRPYYPWYKRWVKEIDYTTTAGTLASSNKATSKESQ